MTFPGDDVMWTLDTLCRATEFQAHPDTGLMVVVLPGGELREVGPDEWDALCERGWVAVTDGDTDDERRVDVTEQGWYAVRAWAKWKEAQAKERERKKSRRIAPGGVPR